MRILSLHPTTTELVFALGAGNFLVGRTDRCCFPEAALLVPSIGDIAGITAETITVFEPDLILLGEGQEQLHSMHGDKSVLVFAPRSVDEFLEKLASLGEALGKEIEADLLVHDLEILVDLVKKKTGRYMKTKTYLEQEQLLAPADFVDDLIKIAGGEPTRFGQNPQVIIAATANEDYLEGISGRKGWEQVQAMRHERLFHIDEQLLQPTPRMADGLKLLAKYLHGTMIEHQVSVND